MVELGWVFVLISNKMNKKHRVFIAINLPEEIKKELGFYAEKWPELPARWTRKDNLHITVEFLGDLTDEELADACQIAGEVAKRHTPFSLVLNKVLYGPPKKFPPRMVWVQGEKSEELAELKNELQEYLVEKIKFRPDEKAISTHITLARISEWEFKKFDIDERPEIDEGIDLSFTVESIEVMESELTREGPRYTILESHILGE
jgi:2'-5' RNA ligase